MSVWTELDWTTTQGKFGYYRSAMVSAVLRTCIRDVDLFMLKLRDRVFDLDEVIWMENRGLVASLFMYLMMSGYSYNNLAAHVVRQGCAIDMKRFFMDQRRMVNAMGYAVINDRPEVVLAMMERGFSCTERCATAGEGGGYLDAVELAIEHQQTTDLCSMLRRILDAANLSASQLAKYLRGLKSQDAHLSRLFNKAIRRARAQEPFYAAAWWWKDANESKSPWRDVLSGHVMAVLRELGSSSTPLHVDSDDAQLRGKKSDRPWEEEDNAGMREQNTRPNKLRKI